MSYVIKIDSITEVDITNSIDMDYILEAIKEERFLFRIKFKEKSSLVYFFFRYDEISFDGSLRGYTHEDINGVEYVDWLTPFSEIKENFVNMFEHVCSRIKNNKNTGVAFYDDEKYSNTFFVVFLEENQNVSLEENLDHFYKEIMKAYRDLSNSF